MARLFKSLRERSLSVLPLSKVSPFVSVAFVLILVTGVVVIRHSMQQAEGRLLDELNNSPQDVSIYIQEKLKSYEFILRAADGFIQASDFVSQSEWRAFIDQAGIGGRFAGVMSVGFVQNVDRKDLPKLLIRRPDLRGRLLLNPEAEQHAIFTLHSLKEAYTTHLGFDIAQDVRRYSELKKASVPGQVLMTPVYPLIAGGEGFGLVYPVFTKSNVLKGWIVATLEPKAFFASIFASSIPRTLQNDYYVRFELPSIEGVSSRGIFEIGVAPDLFLEEQSLEVFGVRWTLKSGISEDYFNQTLQQERWFVYFTAFLLFALILAVAYHLIVSRIRLEKVADEITQKLAETTKRHAVVMEHIRDVAFQAGPDGRWIFLSKSWEALSRDSISDALGKFVFDYLSEEHLSRFRETFERIRLGKANEIRMDLLLRDRVDGYRWVELHAQPQRSEAGEFLGLIGTLTDIEERKKAESRASSQMKILSNLISEVPFAMAILDPEMRYIAHSKQWALDYGLDGSILGRGHYEVFPDLSDEWKEVHQRCLKGEVITRDEDAFVNRGFTTYLRWAVQPWYHEDGKIGGLVMATQIINDLVMARESALKALHARSEFLAKMTHEIRTPLNGILGVVDLFQMGEMTAEQRDLLEMIRGSSLNLLGVVNDVLDFSKLEVGKIKLESNPFSLRELIENQMRVVSGRVWEKDILLTLDFEGECPDAWVGDERRLGQVVLNLLGNAVKFTDKGEICIRVSFRPFFLDESRGRFKVSVLDSGMGLTGESEAIDRLFEAFTQGTAAKNLSQAGTGLGLTISRELVHLMGGRIGARPRTNGGSEFWFEVELERAPDRPITRYPLRKFVAMGFPEEAKRHLKTLGNLSGVEMHFFESLDQVGYELSGPMVCALVYETHFDEMPELQKRYSHVILMDRSFSAQRQSESKSASNKIYQAFPIFWTQWNHLLEYLEDPGVPGSTSVTIHGGTAPLRVLVVEDNEINQIVLTKQLQALGYHVTSCGNGELALNLLRQFEFDAVLMDIRMPVMDGMQCIQEIRQDEKLRHLKVAALTAQALVDDRRKCIEAGFDDYLSKPCSRADLKGLIERLVPVVLQPIGLGSSVVDSKLLEELRPIFVRELESACRDLSKAMECQEVRLVVEVAHRLKSAARYIGEIDFGNICEALEAESKAWESSFYSNRVEEFKDRCHEIRLRFEKTSWPGAQQSSS